MEEYSVSFFINGIKLQIESSFNKLKEINSLIFNEDIEENILNSIFINNINLFREIITQNNLHFLTFWNHIGKIMKPLMEEFINKSEEELFEEKEKSI